VSSISTHVLDNATGQPAEGMAVTLASSTPQGWSDLGHGRTDVDGRVRDWGGAVVVPGIYRLRFDTGEWFAARGRECFYPEVCITFTVADEPGHHHVPLLLAPYAYSTYRGS
jgi:5-hydroxyisourate hydrolase